MTSASVSLVIPGRNCAATIAACLDAAVAIRSRADSPLGEILFVDDGSSDDTASIVRNYPVRAIVGPRLGPGAARNAGWREAKFRLVWFVDADCVAEADALDKLLPYFAERRVAGAGGSYANARPDSLLACLIHEEIALRHRRMSKRVDFLGGFNVVYRREVLEGVGGFDEHRYNGPRSPGAEDAELAYRVVAAGHELRFDRRSRVAHHHPTRLMRYLRAQRDHGYWRVFLHMRYRRTTGGDAYSGFSDHIQPPLALLHFPVLACALAVGVYRPTWALPALLAACQIPVTAGMVRDTRRMRYLWFIPLGFVRSFWRAAGMLQGLAAYPARRDRAPPLPYAAPRPAAGGKPITEARDD